MSKKKDDASQLALELVAKAAAAAVELAAGAQSRATALVVDTADTASKLTTHEAVCLIRYGEITRDLNFLKKATWSANGLLIATLLAAVAYFLAQKLH